MRVAKFESCGRRSLLLQGNWEIWRAAALEGTWGFGSSQIETVLVTSGHAGVRRISLTSLIFGKFGSTITMAQEPAIIALSRAF